MRKLILVAFLSVTAFASCGGTGPSTTIREACDKLVDFLYTCDPSFDRLAGYNHCYESYNCYGAPTPSLIATFDNCRTCDLLGPNHNDACRDLPPVCGQ